MLTAQLDGMKRPDGSVIVDDDDEDDYEEEDLDDVSVPLTVTMLIIGMYIVFGAVLFG